MGADMITTKEILAELDIESSRTLRRWAEQDLLPKPTVKHLANGRGRTSYWPDFVLERCRTICHMRKSGMSLRTIRNVLGSCWKLEHAKHRKRRTAAAKLADSAVKRGAVATLHACIMHRLTPFFGGIGADVHKMATELHDYLYDAEVIDALAGMLAARDNPVLLYMDAKFCVVNGHDAERCMRQRRKDPLPVIAMPISGLGTYCRPVGGKTWIFHDTT